jgi:hypothetical protein
LKANAVATFFILMFVGLFISCIGIGLWAGWAQALIAFGALFAVAAFTAMLIVSY